MSNHCVQASMRARAPTIRSAATERAAAATRREDGPWPPDPTEYAYTADLSPFGWAWEFLRRDPRFRRQALGSEPATGVATPACRRDGGLRIVSREPDAARWGLEHFPMLHFDGVEAGVFWTADAIGGDLEAFPQVDGQAGADLLRLGDIPGRKAVLIPPDERVRVLVEAAGYAEVLSVAAPDPPLSEDSALALGVGDWSGVDARIARLAAFAAFCRAPDSAGARWRRSARRLLDALVALDGWLAGRSYREIAHAFHDPLEIEDDWRGPGAIKLRMRRRVAGGVTLMRGGYRRLLTASRSRRAR